MQIGEYDIPEGWESMSCFYNCGYLLVWKVGSPEADNAGTLMEGHYEQHEEFTPKFVDWLKLWKGEK